MAKAKFKVGDKVRILPEATLWNVPEAEVGKLGVIDCCYSPKRFRVYMDELWVQYNEREKWEVHSSHIELAVKPGQQLLFAFMEQL